MIETTDVALPKCECAGCSSELHKSGEKCGASAGGKGTVFCVPCETARARDSKQWSETIDPSGDAGDPAA
jgi:hypothetical protein